MKRSEELKKISTTDSWDVIIIGGGASGLGTAVDATTRGYKTILLESHDFAKGTSSRATKLVHGGVRYLAQGDIGLVKEALKERGLLAKNATHLVIDQPFIIPNYSWWEGPFYRIGLGIYGLLAGKLNLGKTRFLSKSKTLSEIPSLKSKELASGVLYHDGRFDDSRLAINLAQTAAENGACILNHAKVIKLIKSNDGQIAGVIFKDQITDESYTIKGKVIINATGVFTNEILKMDSPSKSNFIVPSQGVHLVVDHSFLSSDAAIMIPKTSDGRVLFIIPWHDKVVMGTTDTLVKEASYEPRALEQEVDFILQMATQYLAKAPTRADVLSVYAGLRPLAAPDKGSQNTKEVSRSHKIVVSSSGLISIIGGKWTTYRKMAEDILNKAIEINQLPPSACKTENLSIHGNQPTEQADMVNHLYVYGSDRQHIELLMNENHSLHEKIHPNYNYTLAEVLWAVREEMAETVEDVLSRRVRLLFIDARAAIEATPKTATTMAKELKKDQAWIEQQITDFTELAKGYLLTTAIPTDKKEKVLQKI